MKKPQVLALIALVFLSWDAAAQARSNRHRRGHSGSQVLAGPLGSAERTRLLEKVQSPSKASPEVLRLGSAERRALLTGSSRSSLYPRRRNHR